MTKHFCLFSSFLISLALLDVRSARGADFQTEQARSADAFIDGIGVNAHFGYGDTIYGKYDEIIKPRLVELGIRHVRDGYFRDSLVPKYQDIAKSGIKLLLILKSKDAVRQAKEVLPLVSAFEGENEPDHGAAWEDKTRAEQRALYAALKSDPATAAIPVLVPGMANTRDSAGKLGSLADALDIGNFHPYAGGKQPTSGGWGITMDRAIEEAHKVCGDKPLWATECGYHNRIEEKGHPGVSELAAAKYMPRLQFLMFNKGIARSYSYEFADQKPDDPTTTMEMHFGLLRHDGSPKPAFVALKNLIALLRDPGPSFSAGSLAYRIEGWSSYSNEDPPDKIKHTLLEKRDGRFYLAIWLEVNDYDLTAKKDVEVPEKTATLVFERPVRSVVTYQPNRSVEPIAKAENTDRVALSIGDEVRIVEMTPRAKSENK